MSDDYKPDVVMFPNPKLGVVSWQGFAQSLHYHREIFAFGLIAGAGGKACAQREDEIGISERERATLLPVPSACSSARKTCWSIAQNLVGTKIWWNMAIPSMSG